MATKPARKGKTRVNAPSPLDAALGYIDAGLKLVPVGNDKKPIGDDGFGSRWNQPENIVSTPEQARKVWGNGHDYGIGVHLASSGVASFDVDDMALAVPALRACGIDVQEMLAKGWLVTRGSPNKGRAEFRDPGGLRFRNLRIPKVDGDTDSDSQTFTNVFELRAEQANLQDVLPPSMHPDGTRYEAAPMPTPLPELPLALLNVWRNWDAYREKMLEALGVPKQRRELCRGVDPWGDAVCSRYRSAFNEHFDPETILERNGYRRKGERWKHAGSKSSAGVRPFKSKEPGPPVLVSENFGDPLYNDARKPFDAWAAYVILEHGGDSKAAETAFREALPDLAKTVEELVAAERPRATEKPVATPALDLSDAALLARHAARGDIQTDEGTLPFGSPEWLARVRSQDAFLAERDAMLAAKQVEEQVEESSTLNAALDRIKNWKPLTREQALAEPRVDWLVSEMILSGKVGTFIGTGGTTKTTQLIHMMHCIALGEPWFGFDVIRPGSSVLLSGEDDQEDLDGASALLLKERLKHADPSDHARIIKRVTGSVRLISLRGVTPAFVVKNDYGSGFTATGVPEQMVEALKDIPDLRLIVPDTLRRFAQAASTDEDAIGKAIRGGEVMSEMLPSRPTVIFPHHKSKADHRSGVVDQHAGLGSTIIGDNTRFGIALSVIDATKAAESYKLRTGAAACVAAQPEAVLIEASPLRGSLLARKGDPFLILRDGWLLGRADERKRSFAEQQDSKVMSLLIRLSYLEASAEYSEKKISGRAIFTGPGGLGGKAKAWPELLERARGMRVIEEDKKLGWRLTRDGRRLLGSPEAR